MERDNFSQFTGDEKVNDFLIVAIGASAGGVQALKEFFLHVPDDTGMAYVVILHLSPDFDSQLAQILQTVAKIPVQQVTEPAKINPNNVYVVPPNQHLFIRDGHISPSRNMHIEDRRAPVDIFFRHLADTHGPRAVCVVLSGTGANGSMGLKRVKERGGVAYVQNPREAEYNEMPRNSIATDLVDEVLPVAEIPARIIAYSKNVKAVQIEVGTENRPEPQQHALREIFTQLRVRTGHDFTNYKRPTLLRRIERRINIRSLPDLPSYTTFLQEHPIETNALLKDLLISVTNFFRDQKAFDVLEQQVLPILFEKKTSRDQVRVWTAGCATGEEAYSIAMLCAERAEAMLDPPKIQVFASDIDETAITTAREGYYSVNDTADVSPERLRRFFQRDGDGYRVKRDIREMVIFAHHNFLKDPPFTRLDMVTCRNVLIYLNNTAQERVIETFHFALHPRGFLFLGNSESVDGTNDLYTPYSRENHIFQTREVGARHYPLPESVPTFHFSKSDALQKTQVRDTRQPRISYGDLHQQLLEQYGPPSLVVNEEYEIVHMTDRVGRYLEFQGGQPSQNLLKLIRPEIRLELRSALYQAAQHKKAVEARNVKIMVNGEKQSLNIQVRPVLEQGDSAKGFILVVFEQKEENPSETSSVMVAPDEPMSRQLEEELIQVKTHLRNSVEQHEYQAEELKASNEELHAMNEELRSAAEELETSKEELQSINEELRTVNQELKVKIDEISTASNNLQNLINSAEVGTIFLDRGLCVRLFTPAVLEIVNLKSGDLGRPVTDITHKLQYEHLLEDVESVLEKLSIVEKEVRSFDGRYFLMRMLPYRTADDRINGVVITFVDITRLKESEKALHASEEKYRLSLVTEVAHRTMTLQKTAGILQQAEELSGMGSWEYSIQSNEFTWSDGMYRLFEMEKTAAISPDIFVQLAADAQKGVAQQLVKWIRGEARDNKEIMLQVNIGKKQRILKIKTTIIQDEKGMPERALGVMLDITAAEETQKTLKEQAHFISSTNAALPDILFVMNLHTRQLVYSNHSFESTLGYSDTQAGKLKMGFFDILCPEDLPAILEHIEQMKKLEDQEVCEVEYRLKAADGTLHWFRDRNAVFRRNEKGEPIEKIGIAQEITEAKKAEESLREMNTNLRYANQNLQQFASIASHDLQEPLRKLQLFASVLKRYQQSLPGEAMDVISKMGVTADRMSRLIREVLHYSKIAYGEREFSGTDLDAVMQSVFSDLELLLKDAGAEIQYEQKLPVIQAIPMQMHQLFYNLVSNAVKFRKEIVKPVISITTSNISRDEIKKFTDLNGSSRYIEVVFSDNGIGFDKRYAEQIFQIFERLHSVEEFEGTGVGLALCKKIVENHSGHIYAESAKGAGSSFHILLPVKQSSAGK